MKSPRVGQVVRTGRCNGKRNPQVRDAARREVLESITRQKLRSSGDGYQQVAVAKMSCFPVFIH